MEGGRQLHPEIKVCAPVTSLPLRDAIVISPVEAMTVQAWGAQDIAEEYFTLANDSGNYEFLVSNFKISVEEFGRGCCFSVIPGG